MPGLKPSCPALVGSGWTLPPGFSRVKDTSHSCVRRPLPKPRPLGERLPAKVAFSYSISVRRVNEVPRLSRPFSDESWARVQQVARAIDGELADNDVRLTMGGEPTFVGIDDPESSQWHID